MELQYTHTFRVTMTRSHRNDNTHTHASIKTNNQFDMNAEYNAERDVCIQLKKQTSNNTNNTSAVRRPNQTRSPLNKLMDYSH